MGIDGRRGAAQSDRMVKRHVVADDRGFADDDAGAVVDDEPPPDFGAGMNFDGGDDAAQIRDKPGQQEKLPLPQPVGPTVNHQGMKTWIAKHDFEPVSGRRITFHERGNIFAESLEHSFHHIRLINFGGHARAVNE